MKRRWHLGMAGLLALSLLSSCTIGGDDADFEADVLYKEYQTYQENGGTLSYSDWLAMVRGETTSEETPTYFICTFNNWDGTKLYENYFPKGGGASYEGPTPTKPDTTAEGHTASWQWTGWDKSLFNITAPTVFTAQFSSPVSVTFNNFNGNPILQTTFDFGETPYYTGGTPKKPSETHGSSTTTWNFVGWDKEFAPVYEPTVYTALFESPNAVECTFRNEDGSDLEVSYCALGGSAVYSGKTPTKEESRDGEVITRYTFKGWDKPLTNMQEDTVFTAQFDEATYYVCKFLDWDGTLIEEVTVPKNGTATCSFTPHRDPVADGENVTEYKFVSWDKMTYNIASPTSFTASYSSNTYQGYILTFFDAEGNRLRAEAAEKEGDVAYSGGLKDLVDACYSYDASNVTMFVGWDSSLGGITSSKDVHAVKKTLTRSQNGEYPQTAVSDDATLLALNRISKKDKQGYATYQNEKYCQKDGIWRKVEPIKWRYLRNVSTGVSEFLSEKILDTHVWNESVEDYEDGTNANSYARSDIRAWLNDGFLKQAFYYDQSILQASKVDNGPATTSNSPNENACDDTNDKVYLPSYKDATNIDYGFWPNGSDISGRIAYDADSVPGYWWTRSPYSYSTSSAAVVSSEGYVYDWYSIGNNQGVRPCVQFSVA